jgi:hypothetical protein
MNSIKVNDIGNFDIIVASLWQRHGYSIRMAQLLWKVANCLHFFLSYVFWALQRNICNTYLQLSPLYILRYCYFCRSKHSSQSLVSVCKYADPNYLLHCTCWHQSARASAMVSDCIQCQNKICFVTTDEWLSFNKRIHAYPQAWKVFDENFVRVFNCSTRATRSSHLIHLGYIRVIIYIGYKTRSTYACGRISSIVSVYKPVYCDILKSANLKIFQNVW